MSEDQTWRSQTTADYMATILRKHPNGITMEQLIGALVSPTCKRSEAFEVVRSGLSGGRIRVGWASRLYAPRENQNASMVTME